MAHETPLSEDPKTDQPDVEDEPANAPAPTLNRAERRAQGKGKAPGAGGRPGTPPPTGGGRSGSTGTVVPVRFPRTGNK